MEGEPVIVIKDGKVIHSNLKKEKLTTDNLEEAVRSKGLKDFNEVELGILETDGEISIIPVRNRNWRVIQRHKKLA